MTRASDLTDPRLTDELTALVAQAAATIMDIRSTASAVRYKSDSSPVTAADEASEEIICEGLRRLLPGLPVISEEAAAKVAPRSIASSFALVDPLDGTREFVAGRDEFTVNLAIVVDGRPIFGLVSAPALHFIWRGIVGTGAERVRLASHAKTYEPPDVIGIRTRPVDRKNLQVLVSRSHPDEQTAVWLQQYPNAEHVPCGSALKFCRLAEGMADIYPRLAPTMEWDVAAGDAVLTAAGGVVTDPDGVHLTYGMVERDLRIPAFIAWGQPPR